LDLGDTNIVPVDYVAAALDHLAHQPGLDGRAFHLVNPDPQPTTEVVNLLAGAARAPRFTVPVDRRVTGLLPSAAQVANAARPLLDSPPVRRVLQETVGRAGIPPEVLGHV